MTAFVTAAFTWAAIFALLAREPLLAAVFGGLALNVYLLGTPS